MMDRLPIWLWIPAYALGLIILAPAIAVFAWGRRPK